MKLNIDKPNIEMSAELDEKFFSIADAAFIFDILRSKMYSNPISAICREISCNARDAHREAGKFNEPIHIHLPNNLEPYYKIKDFGTGISPDRMENIFIKYAASTKREDNVQLGAFGLGAKTPFAYSDSFSIITHYNGTRYNYSCFIDETKIGKLVLLSEMPTQNINGTEIIIPVKPADFVHFKKWTEHSTQHWDVRPIIKGDSIEWKTMSKLFEEPNWFLNEESRDYYGHTKCKIIIDGIEYPLELEALKTYADIKIISAVNGVFYLNFNIGELTLSANREQIYLDNITQSKISKRLSEITEQVKKIAQDKIAQFTNLWEASCFFKKELAHIFRDTSVLGNLAWRGITLTAYTLAVPCIVYSFSKDRYGRRRHNNNPNSEKIKRYTHTNITFDPNSRLIVNDLSLKAPTPRHIKKALEQDSTLTSVQVVCPSDKCNIQTLNDDYNLKFMNYKLLSEFTTSTSRNYTPATSRLLLFKFNIYSALFQQVSYSSAEEDSSKKKILCNLVRDQSRNYRQIQIPNKGSIDNAALRLLNLKFPDIVFYGIDSNSADAQRIKKDFADFELIEDFLQKLFLNKKNNKFSQVKYARSLHNFLDGKALKYATKLASLINDPNSLALRRYLAHSTLLELREAEDGLLSIYEKFHGEIPQSEIDLWIKNNPDYNIQKLDAEFIKKYPLISLHTFNFSTLLPAIGQYINLIDAA